MDTVGPFLSIKARARQLCRQYPDAVTERREFWTMVRDVLSSYSVPACFDLNGWTLDGTRSFLHKRLKQFWLTQNKIALPAQEDEERGGRVGLPSPPGDGVVDAEEDDASSGSIDLETSEEISDAESQAILL